MACDAFQKCVVDNFLCSECLGNQINYPLFCDIDSFSNTFIEFLLGIPSSAGDLLFFVDLGLAIQVHRIGKRDVIRRVRRGGGVHTPPQPEKKFRSEMSKRGEKVLPRQCWQKRMCLFHSDTIKLKRKFWKQINK